MCILEYFLYTNVTRVSPCEIKKGCTTERRFFWILYMDGFKLQLHFGKGKDGLSFVVVAGGASEATQKTGALRRCSALGIIRIHVPQQVQLWCKEET